MQRQHCSNMSFNRRNSNSSNSTNTSSTSKLWPRRPSISKVSFPSIKKLTSPSSSSSSKPSSSISSAAKDLNNNTHAKAIQIIDGSDRTTDTLLSQDEISILQDYQDYHRRLHEIREKNLRSVAIACTTEQESIVSSSIQQYEVSNQYSYPPPPTATAGRRSHSSSSTKERSRSSSRSKESKKHPSPQPHRRSSSRGRRQRSSSSRRHSTYESTNISNMTLTATKRQQQSNANDDVEIVPTLEQKQSYIDQLACQTAIAMSTTQEYTLPTRRISSGTASNTLTTCDDHTEAEEEDEDECSTTRSVQKMEISFPDICCPHHSYVHLKRYSTKTNKWLTLLEECPVCYKLQLPSLIQEQKQKEKEQQQQQQRQKQQQQQQHEPTKGVDQPQHQQQEKERRRSKSSRRRSSTSSQGSNRSNSSYNKIFKIDGQYVLSL